MPTKKCALELNAEHLFSKTDAVAYTLDFKLRY
jgi:hypothetical protein